MQLATVFRPKSVQIEPNSHFSYAPGASKVLAEPAHRHSAQARNSGDHRPFKVFRASGNEGAGFSIRPIQPNLPTETGTCRGLHPLEAITSHGRQKGLVLPSEAALHANGMGEAGRHPGRPWAATDTQSLASAHPPVLRPAPGLDDTTTIRELPFALTPLRKYAAPTEKIGSCPLSDDADRSGAVILKSETDEIHWWERDS